MDTYRRRLNRKVWSFGGRVVWCCPEWAERLAWRDRMARAAVYEANHGMAADSYRDRLATWLPCLSKLTGEVL